MAALLTSACFQDCADHSPFLRLLLLLLHWLRLSTFDGRKEEEESLKVDFRAFPHRHFR